MNPESLLFLLGEWLAKGVAVLLVAGLIARFLRGSSAAQRHLVWLAAITILLILPATRLMTPRWKVALEKPQRATITVPMATAAPVADLSAAPELPVVVPRELASWRLPEWRKLVLGLWLVGACGVVGARLLGSWRLRGLEKRSALLEDDFIEAAAERVFRELGIGRAVTVRVSNECRVPITWGIWRPVVLLPIEAGEWSGTRVTAALQHEAGHIRRRDYLSRWLAHLACALYWPNPLVWLAARSLRIAQEQATDDLVLRAGTPPEEYASQLFDTARTVAAHGMFTRHAVAMASPSTLEDRVLAIVDTQRDRRPLSGFAAAFGTVAAAIVLAICTAAQVRGADPASPAKPADTGVGDPGKPSPQIEIETKFVELTGDLQDLSDVLGAKQGVFTDPQFQVIIRALNQRKGVDLLAAPRVTTRSKQNAVIEIVREFRYATDWISAKAKASWEPTAFDNKKVGVTLEVTPEVKADGSIDLKLKGSVVQFLGFTDLDAPKKQVDDTEGKRLKPNFSERKLDATAALKSGETLAFNYDNETIRAGGKTVTKKQIVFVSARNLNASPTVEGEAAAAKTSLQERIGQIIIPKLNLRENTLEESVAVLLEKSVEHSADGKGVNMILKDGGKSEARITVSLTNVPLVEALRYVTGLANYKFNVEPYAIAIVPAGEAADVLITKEWKIAPDLIPATPPVGLADREAAKQWLEGKGIIFKGAASAILITRTNRLIVRNTRDQIDLVNAIVEAAMKERGPDKKEAKDAALKEPQEPKEPVATEKIRSKLEGTIIPKLELREMTVAEVVDLLNKRTRELDPDGKGVEILLQPGTTSDARITLSLTNVPLIEALRYVAGLSELQLVIEPNRVVLQRTVPGAAATGSSNTNAGNKRTVNMDDPGKLRVEGDKVKADTGNTGAPAYAVWVAGKPGFVVSPHAVLSGYVDVRGFQPETEVKCPYTGKLFRVPPLPSDDAKGGQPERPSPSPIQEGPKESLIEGRAGVQIQSGNAIRGPVGRRPGQN